MFLLQACFVFCRYFHFTVDSVNLFFFFFFVIIIQVGMIAVPRFFFVFFLIQFPHPIPKVSSLALRHPQPPKIQRRTSINQSLNHIHTCVHRTLKYYTFYPLKAHTHTHTYTHTHTHTRTHARTHARTHTHIVLLSAFSKRREPVSHSVVFVSTF